MLDEKLEELTKRAYTGMGIISGIIGSLYAILFFNGNICMQTTLGSISVIAATIILSVFSILSIKFPKLRNAICFLLAIAIAVMNTSNTIKVDVLFIMPILLALYSADKRYIVIVAGFTIDIIALSYGFRVMGFNEFIVTAAVSNYVGHLIAVLFSFFTEILFILLIMIPYYNYIIDLKLSKTIFLEEKANAADQILRFCTMVMGFHNKYLRVHNTGVERITDIIMVDLCKNPKYKKYLTPSKCQEIAFSVQFHDIGKIYIDSAILDKPGKLTDEEFDIIKTHPVKGIELIKELPESAMTPSMRRTCLNVIIEHHERLDGSGYPGHKKNLTLEGQIIGVADVVDALLSWRPYKVPFNWDKMVKIITEPGKFNKDCINAILNNKAEIMKIAEIDNKRLSKMFGIKY